MNKPFVHDLRQRKRLTEPGLLIGVRRICRYCTIGPATFYALQQAHQFPVARLPDGRWMTTKPLIDRWVLEQWTQQQVNQKGRT